MIRRSGFGALFRALVSGPARRHPARSLLPVLGVAIGVAAVAAIYRANASVTESFRDAAASLAGRSDFVVRGVAGVPVESLERLAFLWKVGAFAPAVTGWAALQDGSGELAEILGVDPGGDAVVRDLRIRSDAGESARAKLLSGGAVLVPETFAARHRLVPGATLRVAAGGRPSTLTVAGILELSGAARAAGGDLLVTDVFTAQRILGRGAAVDRVDVVLRRDVDRARIEREVRSRLPPGLFLEPPTRSARTAERMVRAFRFNLNALGSLTLLVGMFLIANAVSVSVLRRRPEIATLRSLGAGRLRLFLVFLAEGLAVGALGTALGEAAGVLLSRAALRSAAGTVTGVYLPTARIAEAGYTKPALVAALVGIVSALAAAALPALEATRVEPSPGMRAGSIESVRRRRLAGRAVAAAALLLGAAALSRLPAVDGFPAFGFGAVALVVAAVAAVAPIAIRAADRIAAPSLVKRIGAPGRLAGRFFAGSTARNAISVTALAMMVTVASIRETVRVWIESTLRSDLWVKAPAGRGSGIVGDLPEEVVGFLSSMPGVSAVDPFRARDITDPRGRPYTLASGDFRVVARMGGLPLLDGLDPRTAAAEARSRGEAMVSEPYARRFGVRRGDAVTIPTPAGLRDLRVAGVYRDYSNDRGTIVLDRELYLRLFGDRRVTSVAVVAAPGVDPGGLRRRILAAAAVGDRFALSISTNRELRREALRIFDRTFAVTHALEAIAVAVAILGIANALVASAIERRRSFGLLRAIGASARQIRRAVLLEAALTGGTAAAAAVAAGAAFAYLLLRVINPQSFGWTVALSVPIGRLSLTVLLVVGASVLAGIFPGTLAARVDPVAALAEE